MNDMTVTISTVWALPKGMNITDVADERVATFIEARDEFSIETDPDAWDARIKEIAAEHEHIRVVEITTSYDKIVDSFIPIKLTGDVASS